MIRGSMTERCTIQRNGAATDPYGGPGKPGYADHLVNVHCRGWEKSTRVAMGNEYISVMTVELLVPAGTDVAEGDRVVSIKNRAGVVKWDGPLAVDNITQRHDHLELTLTETP